MCVCVYFVNSCVCVQGFVRVYVWVGICVCVDV